MLLAAGTGPDEVHFAARSIRLLKSIQAGGETRAVDRSPVGAQVKKIPPAGVCKSLQACEPARSLALHGLPPTLRALSDENLHAQQLLPISDRLALEPSLVAPV